MTRNRITPVLAALLASGCTVGPNFKPPVPPAPPAWNDASATPPVAAAAPSAVPVQPAPGAPAITATADPQPDWWTLFNDPQLTALINRAAAGNLDIKVSVAKILAARANERIQGAAGLPSVTGLGSYTYQQESLDQLGGQIGSALPVTLTQQPGAFGLYEGAVDASWEIDLWGKVRRSVEMARAETEAQVGDKNDSLVSLQAEVAQTYAKLRGAQANLAAARADIAAENDFVALTRNKAAHGLVSDADVESAQAQLGSSQASATQYAQQISTDLNSLAVLVGEAPGALDAELSPVKPIPSLTAAALPIGLPFALAHRRPDIRAAEASLHEQTANIGVQVAQLYPTITLTGEVGQQSQQVQNFFSSTNRFFSLGPSLSLPIFQGGKLKAGVRQAKAQRDEALFTYQKTVLSALQDVENALASFRTDQQNLGALQRAEAADQRSVDIALDRFQHGRGTYLDVLTAQNTLIQLQQQRIAAQINVSNDVVTLYKALGGGWQAQDARGVQPSTTTGQVEAPDARRPG